MTEKKRCEVEEKYKWDLSSVYKSNEDLFSDYKGIERRIKDFSKIKDTFLSSGKNLYECFLEYDIICMALDKMWTFVSHRYDVDITDNENQQWKDKVYNLYEKISLESSFVVPNILEFGFDNIKKYYIDYPKLKENYDFTIEVIFRDKDHTLPENEEKLMSSLSKAISETSEIASMLSDNDIDFGTIKDEEDKDVHLSETNYFSFLVSKDQRVRKEAFQTIYKSYKQFNNTFALLLSDEVEKKKAISKVRKFNSSLEAALFADNVSVSVYNNLIDVVNKNLKPLYDYYEVKKNLLGLNELHLYDTYVPVTSNNTKYTFEEAKGLVLNSLSILGEDYTNNLKKAFRERWIDIYPNKGKIGGAYSGGDYLSNPYVLLNFRGTYSDVSTVAHELGHSMHTLYSNKNNPYQYSDYKIFVAEVASQVNELLLNNYMLENAKTKEEKINIVNQLLETFKASIYRQTMFAEFERDISKLCEDGEILTADRLNNTYYDLVKKYFGNDVIIDEEIKYEWERIPHFYYNFYVYKYSTGLASAAHIASKIIKKEEGALENYLNFLKTGGSMYPLEELKIAGVDLTHPEVIQSAMDMFKKYLEEFKELTGDVNE